MSTKIKQVYPTEQLMSRFGEIVINRDNAVHFEAGLLGMPAAKHFCIANFPGNEDSAMKVLQCLDDDISFLALPVTDETGIINAEDIDAISENSDIAKSDLLIMLIATAHQEEGNVTFSVNAQAPIVIDSRKKRGTQHVFDTPKYNIQHKI